MKRKDWRAILAIRATRQHENVITWYSGVVARLSATIWGVELGKGCKFYGGAVFRRAPTSRLVIGEGCVFRSARWSNQIGLDRPCRLSTIRPGALIRIGSGCGLSGTVVAAAEHIELGEDVFCGANVTITDTDWHRVDPATRREPGLSAPIRLENNVWLGLNVIVLKGVTIGHDSVVAAGSVVTRSIPPGVLAAGQPARVIRSL
jgi:hypothetical protein